MIQFVNISVININVKYNVLSILFIDYSQILGRFILRTLKTVKIKTLNQSFLTKSFNYEKLLFH
jgi:hypothetical protein